jgi:transcriptional regulator GlxA family with amidase domain
MMTQYHPTKMVGVFLFDEVEVLDFAGPLEVFSTASRVKKRLQADVPDPFQVLTIGAGPGLIRARANLLVQPQFTITAHPRLDILIIPGGVVDRELDKSELMDWIGETAKTAEITASVCTGAFLLAKAGLLDGQQATTHWEDLQDLANAFPEVQVVPDQRWIDLGKVVTAAGISAGIDMALHLVSRLEGQELAVRTARQMDYQWARE